MGIGHELGSMIFNGIFFFLLLVQRPIFQFETRESLSRAKIATLRLTTRGLSIGGNDFAANKRAAVVDRRFERSDEGLV